MRQVAFKGQEEEELMPGRVVARNGERLVKFVVGEWSLTAGTAVDG